MLMTTSGCRTRKRYKSGSQSTTRTGMRRKMVTFASTACTLARAGASSLSSGKDWIALSRADSLLWPWDGSEWLVFNASYWALAGLNEHAHINAIAAGSANGVKRIGLNMQSPPSAG